MRIEKKWGFALSGGGARGIIHIGVLKAFDDAGFKPTCISGTSMGAVVGALYAGGMKPDEMMELISEKGFLKMFKLRASFSGFLEMSFLKKVLRTSLPKTFEDLNIPLYVSATNLRTHELTTFHTGEIAKAVLASASIPILFEPVEIDGEKYVDGGVVNNLPAFACANHCDSILGVEVNFGNFTNDLENMKNVAIEVFHIMVNKNSEQGIQECHSLIRPELTSEFQILDFTKSQKLYDIGVDEGRKWLEANNIYCF